MEIFYAVAGVGLTSMIGATALVIRSDNRRNRVWAGQWAEKLERKLELERQEDHAASEMRGWYAAQETHEEDLRADAAAERTAAAAAQVEAGAR